VIADDQIRFFGSEVIDSLNIPMDLMDFPKKKTVALDPHLFNVNE
jgi:hypothetical protein